MRFAPKKLFSVLAKTWPWFLPAWLHALACYMGLVPILYERTSENVFATLWLASFVTPWAFAAVPIRRGIIKFEHTAILVSLPYVPLMVVSLATMD